MAIYSKSMRTPIYRQMYAKIHIHIFTPERKMTDGCDIEMFYLELNDKTMCSGCRACEQICPMGSITMDIDGEGFAYPIKERESCNNCNLCNAFVHVLITSSCSIMVMNLPQRHTWSYIRMKAFS